VSLAYGWGVRLRLLLRPGWLALSFVVLLFATACFAVLAPWQFDRHAERSATNDAVTRSFTAPPVDLAELLPDDAAPTPKTEWRTVTITGRFLTDDEVVARLRSVQGAPAFEVLTPFRADDGATVLVDRGYIRPDQGNRVPSYAAAPSGHVTLTGRVRVDERDARHRPPLREDGRVHVYAVGSATVAAATGERIRPGYVQLTDRSPGVLGALPLPELDTGPFLSYALQWLTFGTMAILAWLYFSWREVRPGGVLTEDRPRRRLSVAQQIAEEEAAELAQHRT
jgi:cytochrome oxidase assembly protein ShyY1